MGKGETADYQHFLLFPQCFQKVLFAGSLKIRIVWKKVNALPHISKSYYTPATQMFSRLYWNQLVCPYVCVQNISFYLSAIGGISHI